MARHVKALTYAEKIDAVRSGACRQTIRPVGKRPVHVDDIITFHGWTDRPYRSPWSWRLEVEVTEVFNITIEKDCITFVNDGFAYPWNSSMAYTMAREDYIDPPTGEELRDVLFKLNNAPKEPEQYQIIRWE